jgi:hypothetical protein
MNMVRHLGVLEKRALKRIMRLQRLSRGLSYNPSAVDRRTVAHIVVESANLWSAISRSFYLSCALGARLTGGGRVTINTPGVHITNVRDSIHIAVQKVRPRKVNNRGVYSPLDEPIWYKRNTLLELDNALAFSNTNSIQLALNLQTDVFTDMNIFRNFFAHRSGVTANEASRLAPRYGQVSQKHPADILCGLTNSGRQNILSNWLDDIEITVSYLCN